MNTHVDGERLRAALGAAAGEVRSDPGPYRRLAAAWRRRERRRRTLLTVAACVVFAAADGAGLWALSQADPDTHVIFSDTGGHRPVPSPVVDSVGPP